MRRSRRWVGWRPACSKQGVATASAGGVEHTEGASVLNVLAVSSPSESMDSANSALRLRLARRWGCALRGAQGVAGWVAPPPSPGHTPRSPRRGVRNASRSAWYRTSAPRAAWGVGGLATTGSDAGAAGRTEWKMCDECRVGVTASVARSPRDVRRLGVGVGGVACVAAATLWLAFNSACSVAAAPLEGGEGAGGVGVRATSRWVSRASSWRSLLCARQDSLVDRAISMRARALAADISAGDVLVGTCALLQWFAVARGVVSWRLGPPSNSGAARTRTGENACWCSPTMRRAFLVARDDVVPWGGAFARRTEPWRTRLWPTVTAAPVWCAVE